MATGAAVLALLLVTLTAGSLSKLSAVQTPEGKNSNKNNRLAGDPAFRFVASERGKCLRLGLRLGAVGAVDHRLLTAVEAGIPRLAPGDALLSFVLDGKRMQRWWVNGRGVRMLTALAWPPIRRLVVAARDELEFGSLDPARSNDLLARLHDQLFNGLAGEMADVRRLTVLPDGLLRVIPFAALQAPDGDSRAPLVQRVVISRAPCLGLLSRRNLRWSSAAAVVPGRRDQPAVEAAEVAALPSAAAQLFTLRGPSAVSSAMVDLLRRPFGLVHFAGHGSADPSSGEPPEIHLADGPLTLRDCSSQPLSAQLVVLAGCQTGDVARFRDGQQLVVPVSLADGLLAAGVGAVLSACWTVKEQFAAKQLADFYRRLPALGPARALARAQRRAIRRLRPPHPRFWAAFELHGR